MATVVSLGIRIVDVLERPVTEIPKLGGIHAEYVESQDLPFND